MKNVPQSQPSIATSATCPRQAFKRHTHAIDLGGTASSKRRSRRACDFIDISFRDIGRFHTAASRLCTSARPTWPNQFPETFSTAVQQVTSARAGCPSQRCLKPSTRRPSQLSGSPSRYFELPRHHHIARHQSSGAQDTLQIRRNMASRYHASTCQAADHTAVWMLPLQLPHHIPAR